MDDTDLVDDSQESTEVTPQTVDGSTVLINLESMIKSHISAIDKSQEELSKHKEMLDDILNNDLTYKEHSEKAKEANKIKANTKAQILKQPQAADLSNKIPPFSTS